MTRESPSIFLRINYGNPGTNIYKLRRNTWKLAKRVDESCSDTGYRPRYASRDGEIKSGTNQYDS